MIYTADDEAMKEYSAILQQIGYLDYQRNVLIGRLKDWESAHAMPEDPVSEIQEENPTE